MYDNEIVEQSATQIICSPFELPFQVALKNTSLPALVLDQQGVIIFCNDALVTLIGWQREQVLNQNWFERFVPAEHGLQLKRKVPWNSAEVPPPAGHDIKITTHHGSRLINWHYCALENRQHRGAIIGIGEDLTDCQPASPGLVRAQAHYASLFDSLDGIVWEFDLIHDCFNFVSQQAERLLGYPAHDWYSDPAFWQNHIHPDDRDWVVNHCLSQTYLHKDHDFEYRMLTADNRTIWLRDIVKIVLEDNRPVRLCGLMVDITQAKQTEQNLRRFERIVSATPDGVALLSCDYVYQVVNQTFLDWNHWHSTDIVGYSVADIVGQGVFKTSLQPRLDQALAGKVVRYQEWMHLPALGPQFISVTYAPYYEEGDGITGIVATFRNITELKQAEIALQQQAERESMLANITNHIRQSLDLQEILATAVLDVRHYLGSDRVLIYKFFPDYQSGRVIAESIASGWISLLGREIQDPCFVFNGCVLPYQQGHIQNIPDVAVADFAECYIRMLEELQVHANLVLPILQNQQLWGFLVAQQCDQPRFWQPEEIDFLQQFTDQLAIAIQQSELYTQLQQANQQLHHLANHDQLTGIANRRYFDQHLCQEWQRLARDQLPITLIICDVDYFKRYNDTYGHPRGDSCLIRVAQILDQSVKRPADLVARYGGEEFAIILSGTDLNGAIQVIQDIQKQFQQFSLPHVSSPIASHITLSFGLACDYPSPGSTPEILIERADTALYRAKQDGRNRYCSQ